MFGENKSKEQKEDDLLLKIAQLLGAVSKDCIDLLDNYGENDNTRIIAVYKGRIEALTEVLSVYNKPTIKFDIVDEMHELK